MLKLKAFDCRMCESKANCPDYEDPNTSAGLLSKACSEFKPHVPGPTTEDPNIMELCFHNGERHMKEKVGKELTRLAERMPCITLAQALAMLEGL
jgi:hypothetical protein